MQGVARYARHTHRLSEGQQDLPAENVEVVGGSGAVDHDPVAVRQLTDCKVLSHNLAATQEEMVSTGDIIIIIVVSML